jgi:hypothetical protein
VRAKTRTPLLLHTRREKWGWGVGGLEFTAEKLAPAAEAVNAVTLPSTGKQTTVVHKRRRFLIPC